MEPIEFSVTEEMLGDFEPFRSRNHWLQENEMRINHNSHGFEQKHDLDHFDERFVV